jgi:hypothetical protein
MNNVSKDYYQVLYLISIKKSFQCNACGIKNVKYDGPSYIVNKRFQQHMYHLLNYYALLERM